MDYFSEIPEGQAVICSGGVYRQVKLAQRAGKVYAKYGAGYIRLLKGGGTTAPKVNWYDVDCADGVIEETTMSLTYKGPDHA